MLVQHLSGSSNGRCLVTCMQQGEQVSAELSGCFFLWFMLLLSSYWRILSQLELSSLQQHPSFIYHNICWSHLVLQSPMVLKAWAGNSVVCTCGVVKLLSVGYVRSVGNGENYKGTKILTEGWRAFFFCIAKPCQY